MTIISISGRHVARHGTQMEYTHNKLQHTGNWMEAMKCDTCEELAGRLILMDFKTPDHCGFDKAKVIHGNHIDMNLRLQWRISSEYADKFEFKIQK
ncbi:uncharacterized protein [Chironomus tepperi]